MDIKRMTVPFEIKEMDEDKEFYKFEGYASTFSNVDLGNDRVIPGAFKACISRLKSENKSLPVLWQHDMYTPLGVFTEIKEDEKGLFVKAKMPVSDDFVRGRVFPQMKAGSIASMSIGYVKIQHTIEDGVRNLMQVDVKEISLVTMPMNEMAIITDMKRATPYGNLPLADDSRPWDSDSAIGRIRQFTDSVDEPSAQYKRAFFWFDSDEPGNFGSYKLPFADVIDGKLTAVPRAIFAAAAAMRGARGGVDIPESDRSAVERNINRYYEKMGKESPLKEKFLSISMLDFKYLTVTDIEAIMTNVNCKFSKNVAKKLISFLDVKGLRDEGNLTERDAEKKDCAIEEKLNEIINLLEI